MDEISRRVCRLLDCIGYCTFLIQLRSLTIKHISALRNTETDLIQEIFVGSTGEGISRYYESDRDVILVMTDQLITTESSSSRLISDKATVFRIRKSHPGYCTLQLLKRGAAISYAISDSLVPYEGEWFLSSNVLNAESKLIRKEMTDPSSFVYLSGPAHTTINQKGQMFDTVLSLNVVCHDILHEWYTRPRKHEWPPQHLRQAVLAMKGNIVPIGMDRSETKDLEWRFCFNEIELMLIGSLNDTQIKLNKMLKMINTDILKPFGFGVTSYILKNLVFWLAEEYPQSMFRPETLLCWIEKSLLMLKRAVKLKCIPYYMIPGRNLFTEKISLAERKPLYDKLTGLIKMGPEMVFGCKKIDEARYMTPRELTLFQKNLCEFEQAACFQFIRRYVLTTQKAKDVPRDKTVRRLEERMWCLVRSREWPPHIRQKLNKCFDIEDVFRVLLA